MKIPITILSPSLNFFASQVIDLSSGRIEYFRILTEGDSSLLDFFFGASVPGLKSPVSSKPLSLTAKSSTCILSSGSSSSLTSSRGVSIAVMSSSLRLTASDGGLTSCFSSSSSSNYSGSAKVESLMAFSSASASTGYSGSFKLSKSASVTVFVSSAGGYGVKVSKSVPVTVFDTSAVGSGVYGSTSDGLVGISFDRILGRSGNIAPVVVPVRAAFINTDPKAFAIGSPICCRTCTFSKGHNIILGKKRTASAFTFHRLANLGMFSLTPLTIVKRDRTYLDFSFQPKREFRYFTKLGMNRCSVFLEPLVKHIMTFTMIDSSPSFTIFNKLSISGHKASNFPSRTLVCYTYPWYLSETKHPSPVVNGCDKFGQNACSSIRRVFMNSWSCEFRHLRKSKILQVCLGRYSASSNSKSISASLVKSPSHAISTRASITRGLMFSYYTAPVAAY